MYKKLTLFLIITFVLAGCNFPGSTPPQPTVVQDLVSSTATAIPAPTALPAPTPLPTPAKLASVEDGDEAQFYGDWEAALLAYSAGYENNSDQELRSAALLGLGRTYFKLNEYELSLQSFQTLLNEYPGSAYIPSAQIALAETYKSMAMYSDAAQAYATYLAIRPGIIDSYIQELRGDALVASGDMLAAIGAYQSALAAPRVDDTLPIEIKIANAYVYQDDHNTALIAYQDIFNRTNNDFTKAYLNFLMGQSYAALGQMDQAYKIYLDAVENYPLSYDSYQALIILVEANYPVSNFDRGLVDYYAGQYSLSIAAFDHFLIETEEVTDDDAATADYYRGLSFRALGDLEIAISIWDGIIQSYPEADRWDDAWEHKAYTQWAYLEQFDLAEETLLEFVSQSPWHTRAAEFLFDAGRVAERDRDLSGAAAIWQRIASEYPSSEYVPRSLFLAAISYYRVGDYDSALAVFQRFSNAAATPGDKAAAQFWIGKSYQAQGDENSTNAAFNRAVSEDPTGYYSERARDILLGREPFDPPLVYDLGFDPEYERSDAEYWMREVFAIPEGVDLSGPGPLYNDPRMIRGTELWNIGLFDKARREFESLWQDIRLNPMDNYRLVNYLVELGYYRLAIFAAREVLNLNQMDDAATLNAPIYFNHVRFGSYYRDLVVPISQAYGFHPLFLFSVMRQESLFASWVDSSAAARGLMQIIPSTGASIAAQAGWPENYTADDLYRPKVSVTFGADYLSNQRDYFEGDLYVALAAYNGGPGNAAIWRELAGEDPDLFLEVIRFDETRSYIRGVYEIFSIYRNLYDRTP
ncbi:MAG: tetratricopeptide repeat protein [Anaerolineales bacterium]|nr:tetratricopeptide repeat protein [Chloroflexota bacterium]MBL6981767.1 tetratricopeptide repeat protein [Anaerolineales bacterium]